MKKIFFISYLFVSCNSPSHIINKKQTSGDLFRTIIFANCEYVQIEYGIGEDRVYRLIHKDSCKNHSKWIKSGDTNKFRIWPYSITDSMSHFEWVGLGSNPNEVAKVDNYK